MWVLELSCPRRKGEGCYTAIFVSHELRVIVKDVNFAAFLACVSTGRVGSSGQRKLFGKETQMLEVGGPLHGAISSLMPTGLQLARPALL